MFSRKKQSKNTPELNLSVDNISNNGREYYVEIEKYFKGVHIRAFACITFSTNNKESNVVDYWYKIYNSLTNEWKYSSNCSEHVYTPSLLSKTKPLYKYFTLKINELELMMYTKAELCKRIVINYHIVDNEFLHEMHKIEKFLKKEKIE
jgi:hypothetical protein